MGHQKQLSQVLPSQPIIQDPSMPLLTPPDPTTQLEEARRRLEQEARTRILQSRYKLTHITPELMIRFDCEE